MTVSYTAKVATSSFACFLRLLIRWKASVYKLMWREFLMFAGAYFILNVMYRTALDDDQKRIFEEVSRYCEKHGNLIPVAFILGFYVSITVNRWWNQFTTIPWPSRMAMFVTAHVHGQDEGGRLMRRTIMRYLSLSYVITMSSISPGVKRRFPTWSHMTEAGFMNAEEERIIDEIKTPYNKYLVPLAWCTSLVNRARKEERIKDDCAVNTLINDINEYRGKLHTLFLYDWVNTPLVYTQTVTLSVYTFFLSCLMGRQFLEDSETIDVYVPFFTFMQFMIYMGWLKVAESLVNPMGDDDDDFDLNRMIDRNLQLSYLIVDGMHAEHPQLIKDQYWDTVQFDLPYTAASAATKNNEFHIGSALKMSVSPKQAEVISRSPSFKSTSGMSRTSSKRSSYKASSRRMSPADVNSVNRQPSTKSCHTIPENTIPANSLLASDNNTTNRLKATSEESLGTSPPKPNSTENLALNQITSYQYIVPTPTVLCDTTQRLASSHPDPLPVIPENVPLIENTSELFKIPTPAIINDPYQLKISSSMSEDMPNNHSYNKSTLYPSNIQTPKMLDEITQDSSSSPKAPRAEHEDVGHLDDVVMCDSDSSDGVEERKLLL